GAPLGPAPVAPLGAGTAALPRCQSRAVAHALGRPRGGAHRKAKCSSRARERVEGQARLNGSSARWRPSRRSNMPKRIEYSKVSSDGITALGRLGAYVRHSGLELSLLELVKTRASQLNGCGYC